MSRVPRAQRSQPADHPDQDFPERGASVVLAMYRLENISRTIHSEFQNKLAQSRQDPPRCRPHDAYVYFREEAFALLSYYVDHEFVAAFQWYLVVRERLPKRTRVRLEDNPFHWGLLAMSAASGTYMSPNKLRDLGVAMLDAHAAGTTETEFQAQTRRLNRRKEAIATQAMHRSLSTESGEEADDDHW
ncbi:MAG: hypothetical protein ABI557_20415 [Aureliella sp.]